MKRWTMSVAALAAATAIGWSTFRAIGESVAIPTRECPSEVKQLSTDTFGEMLEDLRQGKAVRIDARIPSSIAPAGHVPVDGSEHVNALRGYGPLPKYARERLLSIYQEAIDGLKARVQTPQEGEGLQDILRESTDMALLEEFLAKQSVVLNGGAFFAEYRLLPSWDGWRVLAELNQTLIVDESGLPIDDPATYGGPRGSVLSRKMAIIVPIELSIYPGLAGALDYKRDIEVAVTQERIDRFNSLDFEVRQEKLQQHIRARRAISALGGSGSGRIAEIEKLKTLLLDVPFVDSRSLLARMAR